MIKTAGLDVLSVGAGDIQINFNPIDVQEVERAKRIITDMLRRGYALFIPTGSDEKPLARVRRFIAKEGVYIIADGPTLAPTPSNVIVPSTSGKGYTIPAKPGRPRKDKKVDMTTVRATVVGRSAGG
jgi:hypothetical protein